MPQPPPEKTTFHYATCAAGAESLLKREVQQRYGGQLTPAFMRPQLITWKQSAPLAHFQPYVAISSGRSLGMARSVDDVLALTHGHPISSLQVRPRELAEDASSPADATWAQCQSLQATLSQRLPLQPTARQALSLLISTEAEPWFVGLEPAARLLSLAELHQPLPEQAPSRAWLKMAQGLSALGLSSLRGQSVLELGSAPGGGSWALLQRGARVYGVDTGQMAPLILEQPAFTWLKETAGNLSSERFPQGVDGFTCDINLPPALVLKYCLPLIQHLQPDWLLITLKINDDSVLQQLPGLIQKIRDSIHSSDSLQICQLPANRREVTLLLKA
jgi:23S rRNA (cytidine2498-2'-O)-methyltransferase